MRSEWENKMRSQWRDRERERLRKWIGKQIKKCNINIVWMREHIRSVEGREMKYRRNLNNEDERREMKFRRDISVEWRDMKLRG